MPRFLTASQIDRLGDRLRQSADPNQADLEQLQRLRLDYDSPLASVERLLRENLDLQPTSRLKTIGTIIDKLKREKTRLSKMQDIGGVRIVRRMYLPEQDNLVVSIQGLFPGSQVVDRRARPNHGYRAVHVIAVLGGCPIEIQVRTFFQDAWAQIAEKLADKVGREIRYGKRSATPIENSTHKAMDVLIEELIGLSKEFAKTEELSATLVGSGADLSVVNEAMDAVMSRVASITESLGR